MPTSTSHCSKAGRLLTVQTRRLVGNVHATGLVGFRKQAWLYLRARTRREVNWLCERRRSAVAISLCRCLCYPPWYEGMPLAVLEAMASGLPIICPDIGAFDFVTRQGAGVRVPFDEQARATKMISEFLSLNLASVGEVGRGAASKYYSWDQVSKHYFSTFESIISGKPFG